MVKPTEISGCAFIAPYKYLSEGSKASDFSMVLVQNVLNNNEYREFWRNSTDTILLDNGWFELGRCLEKETMAEIGKEIGAHTIVMADESMDELDYYKSQGFGVMYCPKSLDDCIDALNNSKIDKVGISSAKAPQWIGYNAFDPVRAKLFEDITLTKHQIKKIHFLGSSNAMLQELYEAVTNKVVNSFDTSLPIWAGLHGVSLSASTSRMDKNCDFETELEWNAVCAQNIVSFKQCFHYGNLQTDWKF